MPKFVADAEIVLADFTDIIDAEEELGKEMGKIGFSKDTLYWRGETDLKPAELEKYIRDSIFPKLEFSSGQTVHVKMVRAV